MGDRSRWLALLAIGLGPLACGTGSPGSTPTGSGGDATTSGSDATTSGATAVGGAGGSVTATGSGGAGGTTQATGGVGATATTGGAGGAVGGPYDVMVDPYGTSPLVAVINLHEVEASSVEGVQVVVTGQDGSADFTKAYYWRRRATCSFSLAAAPGSPPWPRRS